MRLWPFQRRETRDDATDVVLASILANARGEVASGLTAAIETAAGQWGRAFSSATVTPDGVVADLIAPHLGFIGRSLVTSGEAIFEIRFDDGLELRPASLATVSGSPDPETWTYELTMAGPSRTFTRRLPAGRVLHLTYATNGRHPWRGVSPIGASSTTKGLLEHLETRLAQEVGQAVGLLIPVPDVKVSGQLQTDIRGMKGQVALVDSVSTNWGSGKTDAPKSDYKTVRIGADPPETLARLRREAEESILAACGVPQSALSGGGGAGTREQYRQFLHLVIAPVARSLARQIAARFDLPDVGFNFDSLMASDISGRARAFGQLRSAGLTMKDAADNAGVTLSASYDD